MNTDAIPKTFFIPLSSPCPSDLVCSNTVHKVLSIVYLSVVHTKSPTLLSRKATAPLQSFSPEKRLQMSDGGTGEHCQSRLINETTVWNQLKPLRKWGHHLSHWVCSLTVSSSCSSQPLGAVAEAFLETACTPWRAGGLSTDAALHPLLSSHRKLLNCSAPCRVETLGFMSRLESCCPLLGSRLGCCLNQERELLHTGQWQGLAPAPGSDLTGVVGITRE